MGNSKQHFRTLLASTAGLFLAGASALAIDQTEAQEQARRTHDDGSDDSLRDSYKNALHAVGNFYQLNIPGAISYGVKAYGQYRNSYELDELTAKNRRLGTRMSSAGAQVMLGGKESELPFSRPGPELEPAKVNGVAGSPFLRIDPAFLREGDTAEIAEKLEKITGLPREKMFKMAADLHSKNLQRSITDPDSVSWARKAYLDFAEKAPNPEFKETVAKADSLVSVSLAQQVLAQFQKLREATPSTMLAMAENTVPVPVAAADAPVPSTEERDPADIGDKTQFQSKETAGQAVNKSLLGLDRLKFDPIDGYMGELVKTATRVPSENKADGIADGSIFQQVSARIRAVNSAQNLDRRTDGPVVLEKVAQSFAP